VTRSTRSSRRGAERDDRGAAVNRRRSPRAGAAVRVRSGARHRQTGTDRRPENRWERERTGSRPPDATSGRRGDTGRGGRRTRAVGRRSSEGETDHAPRRGPGEPGSITKYGLPPSVVPVSLPGRNRAGKREPCPTHRDAHGPTLPGPTPRGRCDRRQDGHCSRSPQVELHNHPAVRRALILAGVGESDARVQGAEPGEPPEGGD
jgi:hypothetical protein